MLSKLLPRPAQRVLSGRRGTRAGPRLCPDPRGHLRERGLRDRAAPGRPAARERTRPCGRARAPLSGLEKWRFLRRRRPAAGRPGRAPSFRACGVPEEPQPGPGKKTSPSARSVSVYLPLLLTSQHSSRGVKVHPFSLPKTEQLLFFRRTRFTGRPSNGHQEAQSSRYYTYLCPIYAHGIHTCTLQLHTYTVCAGSRGRADSPCREEDRRPGSWARLEKDSGGRWSD